MIRKLTKADRQLFIDLSREFYSSSAVDHPVPESYHDAMFRELMRSDQYAECFILEHGGSAEGYALTAKTFSHEVGGPVVWVEELFVRESARGLGLGSEFLRYAETLGASRLRLEVCFDNERAADLYKRNGYSVLPYRQMIKDK